MQEHKPTPSLAHLFQFVTGFLDYYRVILIMTVAVKILFCSGYSPQTTADYLAESFPSKWQSFPTSAQHSDQRGGIQ